MDGDGVMTTTRKGAVETMRKVVDDGWERCSCGKVLLGQDEPKWVCNGVVHARKACTERGGETL